MTEKQPKDNDKLHDEPHNEPHDEPRVLALTVAYDGAGFAGFARQLGQMTVQGELEHALAILFKREIITVGAGRTDAGVHARNQVVSFELINDELKERSLEKLRTSLNALTSDGLVVKAIAEKPAGFSARFSAMQREYRYRIVSSSVPPVFLARYAWWVPSDQPFDVHLMRQAAQYLQGEHDFKTFCVAKSAEGQTTTRRIDQVFIFGMQHLGEDSIVIQIRGNAFLHSMVRIIVGCLVEVGLRRRPPEWVGEVLAACDRRAAAQTAPAHGLTLWDVSY